MLSVTKEKKVPMGSALEVEIIKDDPNEALGHRPGLRIAPARVKGARRYLEAT